MHEAWVKKVKLCSSEGCTKIAVRGGVCIRHGAKVKLCSSEGCALGMEQIPNNAAMKDAQTMLRKEECVSGMGQR